MYPNVLFQWGYKLSRRRKRLLLWHGHSQRLKSLKGHFKGKYQATFLQLFFTIIMMSLSLSIKLHHNC